MRFITRTEDKGYAGYRQVYDTALGKVVREWDLMSCNLAHSEAQKLCTRLNNSYTREIFKYATGKM